MGLEFKSGRDYDRFLVFRWHLFQCLTALGYTHVSDEVLAHVHTSYASQLENAGLWQWAVFVVLHLDNDRRCGHYLFIIVI